MNSPNRSSKMSDIDDAKSGPKPPPGCASHALVEGGMAELVVGRPLLRILQRLVGLVEILEVLFRGLVAGIAIGMAFLRHRAERRLEILLSRCARHTQNVVVVALGHKSSRFHSSGPASAVIGDLILVAGHAVTVPAEKVDAPRPVDQAGLARWPMCRTQKGGTVRKVAIFGALDKPRITAPALYRRALACQLRRATTTWNPQSALGSIGLTNEYGPMPASSLGCDVGPKRIMTLAGRHILELKSAAAPKAPQQHLD